MFLSGGLFLIYLTALVLYKAAKTMPIEAPNNAFYLVFGKQLMNGKPDDEFRCRLDRLLTCNVQNAILMGGKTAGAQISEAQAGYRYLLERETALPNIMLEDHSRNTLENLKNTRQLLNRRHAVIISNRYHLARCSMLASSLGIPHQLCAAERKFHYNVKNLLKSVQEAFLIHWFYTGKCWAILTKNQRMLEKIT